MSAQTDRFTVLFPADFDAQSEYEMPSRGYLSDVVVQLEDGSRFPVFFIDPVRLRQDLEGLVQCGKACLAEVNMIVLQEVTTASIHKAVEELLAEGYFQQLKPLP
jgi:hypothetical protein